MQKIAVFGLGVTGMACVEYFLTQNINLFVVNRGEPTTWPEYSTLASKLSANHMFEENSAKSTLNEMDLIILSPGIPREHNILQGIDQEKIISDIEYFSRLIKVPIIAITGTNGKTTTTLMTQALLLSAGKRVFMGGNIGIPVAHVMKVQHEIDVMLLEVSSFQLESTFDFHPRISAILNISQNHAERYSSMESYAKAKYRIMQNQMDDDTILVHSSANAPQLYVHGIRPRNITDLYLLEQVQGLQHPKLKLKHNRLNFAFASLMAESLGIKPDYQKALSLFTPAKYRMEYIGQYKGADVYNDAKSTNPSSLGTALDSIEGSTLLIIGGKLRGRDDFSLVKKFDKKLVEVFAFGEAREEIYQQLASTFKVVQVKDLLDLKESLEANTLKIDNILFAPSLPSYDLFKNFEQRGKAIEDMFKAMSGFVASN